MKRSTAEIAKFGIYIMFPIATLIYFGTPDHMRYPTTLDDVHAVQKRMEKTLFRGLPKTKEEIEEAATSMDEKFKK